MNNIKELRKTKNLTQKELADLLNTDQTTVSKWELDRALPTTANLLSLSEIFEVSIDYVLGKSKYYYPENVGKNNFYTAEEREIIGDYRKLTPALQKTVRDTIKTFVKAE